MLLVALVLALASTASADHFTLAGLNLFTHVDDRAAIDLDVRDIDALLDASPPNFAAALTIFNNGKNSVKSSGAIRTLKGMGDASIKGNPIYDQYRSYSGASGYASEFVLQALENRGAFAGTSNIARVEAAKKGIRYQVVWMYVVDELEDAANDCEAGTVDDNTGGVKAIDEAWAFYAGSLEGTAAAGNPGAGKLLFDLATKRCGDFGTCTSSGLSPVNIKVAVAMSEASLQAQREAPPSCSGTRKANARIVSQMVVPVLQGMIRYIHKIPTLAAGDAKNKGHSEGYSFMKAIVPLIHRCNPTVASALEANLDISSATPMSATTPEALVTMLESVYPCLGVTCADVGAPTGVTPCVDPMPIFAAGLEGYRFRSDVSDRAAIDGDVANMKTFLGRADFVNAEKVFVEGGSSVKSSGAVRTLASLASTTKFAGEPNWSEFSAYYGKASYAGDFVTEALRGTGGFADKSDVFRTEAAIKGTQYTIVWNYVMHELYDGLATCKKGLNADESDDGDAVSNVDEAWAFFTGKTSQYLLFAGNVKRCTQADSCIMGKSTTNNQMVSLLSATQVAAELKDCASFEANIPIIKQQMTVPLLQGLLKYVSAAAQPGTLPAGKEWAEGWAFAFSVLPMLNTCDAGVAAMVRRNFDPAIATAGAMKSDSEATVGSAIVSTFACLRVTCSQVGYLSAAMKGAVTCPPEPVAYGAGSTGLSGGDIAGIVIGVLIAFFASLYLVYRYASTSSATRNKEFHEQGLGDDGVGGKSKDFAIDELSKV